MNRFEIRLEHSLDCETETERPYVIVTEFDETGHQEGDIWIALEQLPQLITDLTTFHPGVSRMTTLIEISNELLALNAALDALDGNVEQQTEELYQWFAELLEEAKEARNAKLDNYAALIRELESRATARKVEADRLLQRAKVDSNRAASLKLMLQEFFQCHDIKTIETARYRLTLANNGGKTPLIIDEGCAMSQIPDKYTQVSIKPDLEAIRAALEAGEALPFARLGERGQSIRIK
jgi:flagellin-specific chaperone FliS